MSIIDITWGIGFFFLILYDYIVLLPHYINAASSVTVHYPILITLIMIWSLRLSFFLFLTRLKHQHRDPRYESIQSRWKTQSSLNVLFNYWFQGFLQACLSISFIPLLFSKSHFFPFLPLLICIFGILGESLADYQLVCFKKDAKPNDICKVGLWKFSRHPNYFFDILFWAGISSYTFLCTKNIFVFACPILLYIIMRFVTGRISEQVSLEKKGNAYKVYQDSTFMIFPKLFHRYQ